ncbi:hypothetical protein ACTXT7_014200 [Hymenolepis weldensis]
MQSDPNNHVKAWRSIHGPAPQEEQTVVMPVTSSLPLLRGQTQGALQEAPGMLYKVPKSIGSSTITADIENSHQLQGMVLGAAYLLKHLHDKYPLITHYLSPSNILCGLTIYVKAEYISYEFWLARNTFIGGVISSLHSHVGEESGSGRGAVFTFIFWCDLVELIIPALKEKDASSGKANPI